MVVYHFVDAFLTWEGKTGSKARLHVDVFWLDTCDPEAVARNFISKVHMFQLADAQCFRGKWMCGGCYQRAETFVI